MNVGPEIIIGASTALGWASGVSLELGANKKAVEDIKNRVPINRSWQEAIKSNNENNTQQVKYNKIKRLIGRSVCYLALVGSVAGLFSGLIIDSFTSQTSTTPHYSGISLDASGYSAVSGFSKEEKQVIQGLSSNNIYFDASNQNTSEIISKSQALELNQLGQSNIPSSVSTLEAIKGVRTIDIFIGEQNSINKPSTLVQQAKDNHEKINIFYQAGTNDSSLQEYNKIAQSTGGQTLEVSENNIKEIDQLTDHESISSTEKNKTAEQETRNNIIWYFGGLSVAVFLGIKSFKNRRQVILYSNQDRKE